MSQSIIPLSEMQTRIESLSERVGTLDGKLQSRLGTRAFKTASAEEQADVLVAGALLTTIAAPLSNLVQAMAPLLPPIEGSDVFADIAEELAAEALAEAGVKKNALLLSVAEANTRILPLLEQLATEAEEKLFPSP